MLVVTALFVNKQTVRDSLASDAWQSATLRIGYIFDYFALRASTDIIDYPKSNNENGDKWKSPTITTTIRIR